MTDSIKTAIDDLRAAFPPHPLEPERMFLEWGVSYTDGGAFKDGTRGKQWDELPAQFLEFHHDALLFLGPAALAEVIPAYLAAVLRRDRELDMLPTFLLSVLNRSIDTERFDARFGRLPPAQRQAITHALEAWAASEKDSHNQPQILEALDSYWRSARSGQ